MDTEWVDDDICIHTELNLESRGNFFFFCTKLDKFAKAFSLQFITELFIYSYSDLHTAYFSAIFSCDAACLKRVTSIHCHMAITPYCTGFLVPAAAVRHSCSLVSDSLCPPRAPRFSERSVVRKSSKKRIFQLAVYEEHNECHSQEQKEKQNDVSHQVWLIYFPFF